MFGGMMPGMPGMPPGPYPYGPMGMYPMQGMANPYDKVK